MTQEELKSLQKTLGIEIKDEKLFITAFIHRSYLNEHQDKNIESNERLEFLGDAVLQLISSEYLFNKYTNTPEGELTNLRSSIVCTASLAQESKRLGFGKLLLMSRGEEITGGREREYILANTFEAVLGALYIQEGLDFCKRFLERELLYKVENIVKEEKYKDHKSKLQEIAQEKYSYTPQYTLLESWGPDHDKTFRVAVKIGDKIFGEGVGKSKQKAEMEAAKNALENKEMEAL